MTDPGRKFDYDRVVIGSGFGGAVAALRLAEKGYRVLVLERGRRFADHDLPSSTWQVSRYLWMPRAGLHMLGVDCSMAPGTSASLLDEYASERGFSDTCHAPPLGIFLGNPGMTVPDPYFGGAHGGTA
ncbi:FAD-dependent oxidoreductase [Streptomyces sp. NPDC101776]|uniref:FAD-dependent oxidoreductase n=1 Tax=Streptomyces sp. NPDC101776 TaxID=3366146 RepID=UPI0038074331